MAASLDLDPNVPIGGTTGLSHEHSAAIDEAACWLAAHPRPIGRAPLRLLQETFGLSPDDAMAALGESTRIGDRVEKAAKWLASTPPAERPGLLVSHIRKEFGLDAKQACEACRRAGEAQARAT